MVNEDRPARSAARERSRRRALSVTIGAGVLAVPIPLATNVTPGSAQIPDMPATAAPAPQDTSTGTALYARYAQDAVNLVNRQRKAHGCRPLSINKAISKAAYEHSKDMGVNGYFAHDTPSGVTPWKRMEQAGYAKPAAENIAVGYRTPREVIDGWMGSPAHRENILDCSYKATGVGYYDAPSAKAPATGSASPSNAPHGTSDATPFTPPGAPDGTPGATLGTPDGMPMSGATTSNGAPSSSGPWWTEDFGYA